MGGNAETYVIFHFGGNVRLVSYTLTTANDTQEYSGRNWTAWTIYGGNSPDGEWTKVDQKVGQTLPSANYTVSDLFVVDGTNTTAYQYYKIVIDAIGGADVQQMSDMNFNVACSGGHEHGTEANPHVDKNNDEYCDLCGIFIISPAPQVDGVYQISNAGNLYWFAALVNGDKTIIGEDVQQNTSANAKLINDIVVNKNVLNENGELNTGTFLPWTPIGSSTNKYSGTFDGDNHTISGLYYNNGGTDNVGLFGYLAYGSVKNVGVIDSYFNARNNVGAIVGCIYHDNQNIEGTISNCYNTGVCQGNQYIVGFVEGLRGAKITNCYNTGTIKGGYAWGYAGGVVGMLANAEIANCYNTGSVSGTDPGGILSYTNDISTISNCYYLEGTAPMGIGDINQNHENQPDSKTNTQFASGEVAYLLQGSQDIQVWGQNIDNVQETEKQAYPVFSDARVYKIVEDEETRYSNFMGGSVVWSYEDGVLTIHGSGSMIDFESNETKPWKQYLSDINTVIVKEEITGIGNYAFSDVKDDAKIFFYRTTIPGSLGTNCFKANASVYVPAFDWDITTWFPEPTVMPTYTQTTVNGQQTTAWVGLTGNAKEPSSADHVAINANMTINSSETSLSVNSFGYCSDDVRITIEDGGQLTCQQANGEVTVEKEIQSYSQGSTKWYTISSPLKDEINLSSDVSNITSGTYDLYRYDEPSYTWQNYKNSSSNNFTSLEPGRGYLYANAANTTLLFKGKINTESVTYDLTIGGAQLTGFHLVGNPFTHNITFSQFSTGYSYSLVTGYYLLDGDGGWVAYPSTEGIIEPGQGALIKTKRVDILTINPNVTTTETKGKQPRANNQDPMLSLNVSNGNYSDRAFVIFGEGVGLDKINHENKDIPMLYIPMSDADYAIAMMDENVNEIPVGFETNSMGEFTISLRQENCEFEELYLLDKETGAKVNILEQDYTFIATSGDNTERFTLIKSQGSQHEAQSNFAYINNNDIVIYGVEGNAHIDIYDVMGRRVYNTNGRDDVHIVNTEGYSAGVYVIRLMDENGLRTQKVVIE